MARREKCNFNCKHHNLELSENSCKYLQEHGQCEKLNSRKRISRNPK